MKCTLEGSAFRDAMKTTAVLFDAEIDILATADSKSGKLILEAGRNGVYCKQYIEAEVEEDGFVVLACAHFSTLSLQERMHLQSDGKMIDFKAGKFKGTVAGSSEGGIIENQRPDSVVKATTTLPTEVFKSAVGRVAFGSALPGAQVGIRIQAKEKLVISTTDQYRATLYREPLAVQQKEFDVLLQPGFLSTILSRVQDTEVNIGASRGTFRIKTETLDVYHPAIQSKPEDIEEWITNGIDYGDKKCSINTTAEDFAQALREVSSIHMGALSYETHVDCMIKGSKVHMRCTADHGSVNTSLEVTTTTDKFLTKLSSKYTMELMNLIKAGPIEIGFWNDFILISGLNEKFKGLIPTVAA